MAPASEVVDAAGALALVDALRKTAVGIVVAAQVGGSYECDFANDRAKALLGHAPQRIPSELALDSRAADTIATWLGGSSDAPLTVDATTISPAAGANGVHVVASRSRVGGRAAAVFFLYELRLGVSQILAGRYFHQLVPTGDGLRIRRKTIELVNRTESFGNLTFVL